MTGRLLAEALGSGRTGDLAELHAPDAVLEMHLPGGRRVAAGARAVVDALLADATPPVRVEVLSARSSAAGAAVRLQRSRAVGGTRILERRRHLLHLREGRVGLHVVYPERPPAAELPPLPETDDPAIGPIVARVAAREALEPGISGTLVERWSLEDGTTVFAKHLDRSASWIMRATRDDGREARLWSSGVLGMLPASIDPGVLGAVPEPDGWCLVSADLSAAPTGSAGVPDPAEVVVPVAELHRAFTRRGPEGLCSVEDRLRLFAPATAVAEAGGEDLAPKVVGRGWELFDGLAPPEVVEAIRAIHERPERLAAALDALPATLVHGDLRPANLAPRSDGRWALIDWGLAMAAPGELDVTWLAFNLHLGSDTDGLLDGYRRATGEGSEPRSVALALLATLAQAGCYFGFRAVQDPDEDERRRAGRELAWWVARAREALEIWTP